MRLRRPVAVMLCAAVVGACSSANNNGAVQPTAPGTTATSATTTSTGAASTTTAPSATTAAPTSAAPATTAVPATLAPADIRLGLVEVASVEQPTALAARPGDDTLFVTSQPGTVYAIRTGEEPAPVLDLTSSVESGGEQGLLGIAFSPDGNTVYLNYTLDDRSAQVDAYAVDEDGNIDAESRRSIINIPHPGEDNHNGGHLVVDASGLLYIATGDGGGSGDPDRNALDLLSLLGKILRIAPSATGEGYDLPPDNPFFAMSSKRNEIWSYGLRNPWKFSFDRLTGDLWLGDVGQNKIEEINFVTAADGAGRDANFGWSAFEGTKRYNDDVPKPENHVEPVHEYSHRGKSASVTGGYVYRGSAIPALYGAYLFGDNALGTVWALRLDDDGDAKVAEVGFVEAVSAFGEDNTGEIYAMSYSRGMVYRIVGA